MAATGPVGGWLSRQDEPGVGGGMLRPQLGSLWQEGCRVPLSGHPRTASPAGTAGDGQPAVAVPDAVYGRGALQSDGRGYQPRPSGRRGHPLVPRALREVGGSPRGDEEWI